MADYLPPVVTILTGEADELLAMIAAAKAAMNSMARAEEDLQHALEAKTVAAEAQVGALKQLALAHIGAALAIYGTSRAEVDLLWWVGIVREAFIGQADALGTVNGRLALTSGLASKLTGEESDLAQSMAEKTGAARDQASQLADLGDKMTTTAVKAGALSFAEKALGGATLGFNILGIGLLSWFSMIHVALVLFSSQIIADAVGIGVFGSAAMSALGPVVSALGNLTTQYSGLNVQQKNAAITLDRFSESIGHFNQTGIFGVMYQGLTLVQQIMSSFTKGGVLGEATKAFSDFFGMLAADFQSSAWAQVFGHSTGLIRTDLDVLFGVINHLINLIPALFHNFNSIGLGFLHFVSGVLGAIRAVMEFNPLLTKTAALATFAWGAYKILFSGIGNMPGLLVPAIAGISNLASRVRIFTSYLSEGALTAGSYALGIDGTTLATAALVGANVTLIGVLGLGFTALANFYDANGKLAQGLVTANNATGNNVAGYKALISEAYGYISAARQAAAANSNLGRQFEGIALAMGQVIGPAQGALRAIQTNTTNLGIALGISKSQVMSFANATGVNLSKTLGVTSAQFGVALSKIGGYARAVAASHHPLTQFRVDAHEASAAGNTLTNQVNALNQAMQALVTPTLNVIQDQVTFKEDTLAANAAIAKSHDQLGLQTAASRAATTAVTTMANQAIALELAIKQQTGSTQAAIAPLQAMAAWLEHSGLKGAYFNEILNKIEQAIANLKNKTVVITYIQKFQYQGIPYSPGTGPHLQTPGPGTPPGVTAPTKTTSQPFSPGASPTAVIENHIYIDGKEVFRAVQRQAVRRQHQSGNNGLQRYTR